MTPAPRSTAGLELKDILAGAIFIAVAMVFCVTAMKMPIGSIGRMQGGFFPLALSGVLAVLGLLLIARGLRHAEIGAGIGPVAWRAFLLISVAIAIFALGVTRVGFVPALAATTFVTACASRENSWRDAIGIAVAVAIAGSAIFIFALGLPWPLIGPWLAGS